MKRVFARRLAANATIALLLSLAFAGVTIQQERAEAAPTAAEACPATYSLATYNGILYCEKSVSGATAINLTVPAGIDEIYFSIAGGQGGNGGGHDGPTTRTDFGGIGGNGDIVSGLISVSPGAAVALAGANRGGDGTRGYDNWGHASGGGAGASGNASYAGGSGGGSGSTQYVYGASGGGGGGAATLTIGGSITAVAGGGGGGGGGDDTYGSPGTSGSPRVGQTTGGNGTYIEDKGGGGAGGGGYPAGNGGAAYGGGGHKGNSLTPFGATLQLAAKTSAGSAYVRFLALPRVNSVTRTYPSATTSNATSLSYEVVFSEAVTGFDVSDVALNGTSATDPNWTVSVSPTADPKTFLVKLSNPSPPSGTLGITVSGSGVQAEDRVGVSSTASALATLDRTPPTVVSSVFLPTLNAGELEVVMTFSETISSTVNWNAFTFSGTAVGWNTSSLQVSGKTLKFKISSSSIADDTTLNYSVWTGFVSDAYGNGLVAAYQDSLAIDLDAVSASFAAEPAQFSNSTVINLNFAAPVTGLAVGDLSFAQNSVGCDITGVTGSGFSYQVSIGTCNASVSGTIQVSLTGSAAVSLLGAPSPNGNVLSAVMIYDNVAPSVSMVSKVANGTTITYTISFSETVLGVTTSSFSISHSVAGGAAGWTIQNLTYLGGNQYRFEASNPAALDGSVSISMRAGTTDLAGNPVIASSLPANSSVSLVNPPSFTLGTPAMGGTGAKAVLPEFDLSARGSYIKSIRVYLENAVSGDVLNFGSNSTFGSNYSANWNSGTGILEIVSNENKTEAQWEAAIRSVTLAASANSSVSRTIGVHIKPNTSYSYNSEHFYEKVANTLTTWQHYQDLASNRNRFGSVGYLAHLSTTAELTDAKNMSAYDFVIVGMYGAVPDDPAGYVWVGGPQAEAGEPARVDGTLPSAAGTGYWCCSEPQNLAGEHYVGTYLDGTTLKFANLILTHPNISGVFVEYGDQIIGDSRWDFNKTTSVSVDISNPRVTAVYGTNGEYKRGDEVELSIQFSEAVVVAGTNGTESKLEILPGVFAEYVSGSGTSVLKYRYVVGAGVTSSDLSYVATNSLATGTRTIQDMNGNSAILTLPALNNANSLISRSNIQLSGNAVDVRMTVPLTQSSQATVAFKVNSPLAMDCTTLTANDFNFENLNSASMVVTPGGSSTSCTITIPHTIPKASFGTARLTASSSFEVLLSDSSTYSFLAVTGNSVLVTNPADAGKGEVILDESGLQGRPRPTLLTRIDPPGLLPGASNGARGVLAGQNITAPPAGVTLPELEITGDFRQLANMNESIAARKQKVIRAGDSVTAKMMVPTAHSSQYKVLSYMNVNSGFVYMGEKDFDVNGEVTSDPLVFTAPGQYYVRMYVVAKTATAGTDYPAVLFSSNSNSNFFGQYFSVNSTPTYISQSRLDSINAKQSLELVLIIEAGDNVPVSVTPSAPASNPTTPVTPAPSASPTATASPTPTPKPTPTQTATPKPTPTAKPTVRPTPVVTPTPTPTPSPTATPSGTPKPSPSEHEEEIVAAPETTSGPQEPAVVENLVAPVDLGETLSVLGELGEPVANPALGASGDDEAAPVEFDPMASEESIQAVMAKTTQAVAIVAGIAAAAAAAAGAASAASAAGSTTNTSVRPGAGPSAPPTYSEANTDNGEIADLEISHDQISLEKVGWGDKLALWAIPALTFLDRLSNRLTVWLAPFSPLLSKVTNDGAYLRAMFGSTTLILPAAGFAVAVAAVADNQGQILTPSWELLFIIAMIGVLDAFGGFVAVGTFAVGSLVMLGGIPTLDDIRLLIAVIVIGVGPALITTAFRQLRKLPAHNASEWWERLSDLAVAPFMSGWSIATMISVLPAITGLTVNAANHVLDFGIWVAAFAVLRVILEEIVARYYPQRLDRINPTHIPDSPLAQKLVALGARYALWVLFTGALIGNTWQSWVGSALFLLPTIIGWYQDRFPNVPWLWRILPSGIPGLAFSIVLASFTTALLSQFLGANRQFAEWAFVLLPLPMLLISVLAMFGRFGRTEDEERPIKKFVWLYRLGGVVMLILTLRLVGIV